MPALEGRCLWALVVVSGLAVGACKPKATQTQCDDLVDRYAELVVREKVVDASAEQTRVARVRERDEARGDDAFKNCRSEVSQSEYSCAMRSLTAEQLIKCLE